MEGDKRTAANDAQAKDEEGNGGDAFNDVRKEVCFDGKVEQGLGLAAEAVEQFALEAEGFDQILRLEGFLNGARHAAFLFAHGEGGAVGFAEERARQQKADGCADDGGGRHARVNGCHATGGHDDAGDSKEGVRDDGDETAFNGFGIGNENAQEVTGFAALEKIERKGLDVHIDVAAEVADDARAEFGPDVVGQNGDGCEKDCGGTEEAEEFDQTFIVAGNDSLVDQKAEAIARGGFQT